MRVGRNPKAFTEDENMENEEALNAEMDKMREEDAQFNPNEVAEEAVETPEVEATEEAQETSEEVKEEVKEDEKEKHWAINAMHEERERRKEVQAQMNKMEDRFQKLQESMMPKEPEEPKPDFEDNPAEYLKTELDEIKGFKAQAEQQAQITQAQQQFYGDFSKVEQEFSEKTPDYFDAVKHLYDSRMSEYKTMGYDDNQSYQLAQRDAWNIAQDAINRGKNGAEVFYNLAKTRGYEKGKQTTEKSEIETLKEVKEVAKNTGLGASGDTPKGQVSLSDLASMNDDEFDKLTSGDNWRNMMGG